MCSPCPKKQVVAWVGPISGNCTPLSLPKTLLSAPVGDGRSAQCASILLKMSTGTLGCSKLDLFSTHLRACFAAIELHKKCQAPSHPLHPAQSWYKQLYHSPCQQPWPRYLGVGRKVGRSVTRGVPTAPSWVCWFRKHATISKIIVVSELYLKKFDTWQFSGIFKDEWVSNRMHRLSSDLVGKILSVLIRFPSTNF